MKAIKIIFKTTLILFLIVMVTLAGVGYYAFHHPKEVWSLVERKFLPKDLKISWDDLQFQASAQSARLWRPSIEFRNLCIFKKRPQLQFCLEDLRIHSELSLKKILNPQLEILDLYARSKNENYFQPEPKKEKAKEAEQDFYEMSQSWRKRLKRYSSWIRLHQVELAMNHFEIRSTGGSPLVLGALVKSQEFLESADIELALEKQPDLFLQIKGEIDLNNLIQAQGKFVRLNVDVDYPKVKVQLPAVELEWGQAETLAANIFGTVKVAQLRFENRLAARLTPQSLTANLESSILGLKKPFHQLKPIKAEIEIPQEEQNLWPLEKTIFKASSLLPVFFVDARMRPRIEKACRCQLPAELAVNVDGTVHLKKYFENEEGEITNLQARIENVTNSLFSTRTALQLAVSRENNDWKLAPFIDSQFVLNSFQGLVLALRSQKVLIPVPFASLDGTITLSAHGPVEMSAENWKIPFSAQTNLNSPQQKVDLTSQGSVNIQIDSRTIVANIEVLIRDIALQLPPLDPVYGVPKIAPDKRIEVQPPKVARQKKKQKFNFQLALHVRSERPDSLRLLYPLAKPYIPIDLKIDYQSGSQLKGQIALSPFHVEYLRRRSVIEKFQMTLNKPSGVFPVQGRFRVDQSQYKIYIDILGTLKTPQFVLSSDPYLDRADIISVLLYGRTNDQLVGADAKAVGSFDAAMADRAIGLIGLWAFSSTPIQSFSYNQLNKQYSAQLKITDDTSLAVGTDWEQATSLEVQKRLSDHWMVSASMEPTEEDQQTRKIRLQWEDRF